MPKELVDKLTWLFLLLPGFLCMSIVGLIVELGQLSEFQITFYSFILTLVITAISLPLSWCIVRLFSGRLAPANSTTYQFVFFLVATMVAVALGVVLGFAAEGDRFFVTLRALPITNTLNKRSATRPVVFLLTQNTGGKLKMEGDGRPPDKKKGEAWALVQVKNGKRYEGWPEFYEADFAYIGSLLIKYLQRLPNSKPT